MKLQILTKSVIYLAILSTFASLTSCDSEDNNIVNLPEPQLIDEYYFRGTLDGTDFNIEKNIYDYYSSSVQQTPYSADFGGSQTEDNTDDGVDNCKSNYACGIVVYNSNEIPEAKLYFYEILVGACSLENEIEAMTNFFDLDSYTYRDYYDFNNDIPNEVGFEYFPNNEGSNYYSSRFGDNTNATFQISEAVEETPGIFTVTGTFSCRLYSFEDNTQFKVLENVDFKIKSRSRLEN